jgi:hypothetical protein
MCVGLSSSNCEHESVSKGLHVNEDHRLNVTHSVPLILCYIPPCLTDGSTALMDLGLLMVEF